MTPLPRLPWCRGVRPAAPRPHLRTRPRPRNRTRRLSRRRRRPPWRLVPGLALAAAALLALLPEATAQTASAGSQNAPAIPCRRTPDTLGIRHRTELRRHAHGLDAEVDFALTHSPVAEIAFAPLVFADLQLLAAGPPTTVPCGGATTFRYAIPGDPHVLNVFFRSLPEVPAELRDLSYEQARARSLPRLAATARAVMDVNNTVLRPLRPGEAAALERRLQAPPATLSRPAELRDNYLYAPPRWRQPQLLARLGPHETHYRFGVFFQSARRGGQRLTITCLLGDRQLPAFHGAVAWGGELAYRQAVRLEGHAAVDAPGWHRLRCVVLNAVLDDRDDPGAAWIASTFVYKAFPGP